MNIILASASPRRRELLSELGYEFDIKISDVNEDISLELTPDQLVMQLAFLKAYDVVKSAGTDDLVIGADTIVWLDGKVLGKPKDTEDAINMLKQLSGKVHQVYTGICVFRRKDAKSVCRFEVTDVCFKKLDDADINCYVSTGEPIDKAGSYAIQQNGGKLIDYIDGDYNNVVGLPTKLLAEVLKNEFEI